MQKKILLLFLILTICLKASQEKYNWTSEEKFSKFIKQTHHWGQKGQLKVNNGWSDYAYLRISFDSNKNIMLLNQTKNEFHAEIINENISKMKVTSIPLAGIFYNPKNIASCQPDAIEYIGVMAEMYIYYLSELFPNGPNSFFNETEVNANGNPVEIRFMQGIMKMKKNWKVSATIKVLDDGHFEIKLRENNVKNPILIEWKNTTKKLIPDNNEKLSTWLTCWSGVHSKDKNNISTFKTNMNNTKNIKTFGEIRKQIK